MRTVILHKINKKLIVDGVSILLMLLFAYASISKLFILEAFQGQLMESPLFPRALIPLISILVPASELVVVLLLLFKQTLKAGLYFSFLLMSTFTFYLIALVIASGDIAPCSCGGILESLDFKTHIIFNAVYCALPSIGLYFDNAMNL